MYDEDNDGRYPDESPVEVRYPRSKQEERGDRSRWPWLPGSILEQCGDRDRQRGLRSGRVHGGGQLHPHLRSGPRPWQDGPPAAPAPAGIATCRV